MRNFIDQYCPQYFLKPKTNKIFIVGLPKCGTVSFQQLFMFLGYKSGHHVVNGEYIGKLMLENHKNGNPLVSGKLAAYNAFSQMDYCQQDGVAFPQITLLDQLIQENMDGYFILNTRDLDSHIRSILNWETLAKDLEKYGYFKLGRSLKDYVKAVGTWILDHQHKVRTLFQEKYPNVKFLEVRIDAEDVEDKLKAFFECPKLKFSHLNANRIHTLTSVMSYADAIATTLQRTIAPSSTKSKSATDARFIVLGLPSAKEGDILRAVRKASLSYAFYTTKSGVPLAKLMKENIAKGSKAFDGEDAQVLLGLEWFETGTSLWPHWTMAETLMAHYPKAKFILNRRNVNEHAEALMSATNHKKEKYRDLFLSEEVPRFRHDKRMFPVYIARWIKKYYGMIDTLLKSHPDVQFLDVDMDAPDAIRKLSSFLG